MKVNWKLRLKNKATLIALTTAIIAFVYQTLGYLGFAPKISQSEIVDAVGLIINIMAVLGIVIDPTTAGIDDSEQALCYECPKSDEEEQ